MSLVVNWQGVDESELLPLQTIFTGVYAQYRLPSSHTKEDVSALLKIVQGTYQMLTTPLVISENVKQTMMIQYKALKDKHPQGTFLELDNIADHILTLAENSRRESYHFLCSLYRGVQNEVTKALNIVDASADHSVQPLEFALTILRPRERDVQCTAALRNRCTFNPFFSNKALPKTVIFVLLNNGGEIFSADFKTYREPVSGWLKEYNEEQVKKMRAAIPQAIPITLTCILISHSFLL